MGNILRVNYRKTGGIAGITDIGKGMAAAVGGSTGSAAGANAPGLIWVSISNSAASANAYMESAFGLMSLYYGSGIYNSGYQILPLIVNFISFSDIAAGSINMVATSIRTSGSLALFTPRLSQAAAESDAELVFQMLAIVVSGP